MQASYLTDPLLHPSKIYRICSYLRNILMQKWGGCVGVSISVSIPFKADSGSVGHRSNGSTNLDGSRGSWVSTCWPLT